MKNLTIVFSVLGLATILASACSMSFAGLNDAYKHEVNMDDPNLAPSHFSDEVADQGPEVLMTTDIAGTDRQPSSEKAVYAVRFCPKRFDGQFAFPTTGLCVRKRVYAAVDPKQPGLYNKLKVGRYSSNATGSACSFTVLDNCQIVR